MRKFVAGTVILGTALASGVGFDGSANALPSFKKQGVNVAQANDVLTPSSPAQAKYLGLVSAWNGQELDIRLADGSTRTFSLSQSFPESDVGRFNVGETIAFDLNKKGEIETIGSASKQERFEGQVTNIDDGSLSIMLEDGTLRDIPVSSATISELNLAYGDYLKVTTFNDIPGAVGICKIKRASITPEPVIPVQPSAPVNGLW